LLISGEDGTNPHCVPDRILIVDDDPGFRAFLADLLAAAGYEVLEAADADSALDTIGPTPPKLVVLDVNLPGTSGYEICRRLRGELGERVAILFVSGERRESYDRAAGIMLGANDYMTKPFAPDELLARVQRLLDLAGVDGPMPAARLTKRELEVLGLLAAGMAQPAIADALVISPKTVGTHIEHILSKLGVRSRAQAVSLAYREGLVDVPANRR
jgi:DNA-binding NarL/FixJ family response regulator